MSSKSTAFDRLFQFKRWLGQEIGHTEPRLRETACMDVKSRETLAGLQIMEILSPKLKANKTFQAMKEIIKTIGYARWLRSEFTHLALKKGLPADQTEDLTDFDLSAFSEEQVS